MVEENGKKKLREISVPDTDIYAGRVIDLQDIMESHLIGEDGKTLVDENTEIHELVMTTFKVNDKNSNFFVLSNIKESELCRIGYVSNLDQLSIDKLDDFKDRLKQALKKTILDVHENEKHHGEQKEYFDTISSKVNQFEEGFTAFDIIPTEFKETQDVGVIPTGIVDDTDKATDHRGDSVQVSTDILQTSGLFATSDTNPGLVVAAVSNPATTYDSDYVFLKSQRNPLLERTGFYDYITDTKGNVLMDLYAIPFIYRINTNNTYDLYINIPTTRTKYLNRIAGTLKDDLTNQVQVDDQRTRLNFLDEPMPNNLDESTTKLRVYIDRKFVSIGNVELVEISGNSIPTQIYRDSANNGLYDSIALESRWDGELVEINEPSKDVNKVMLEFECYGTDSQSIHIQGKTLINHVLDDGKYVFG